MAVRAAGVAAAARVRAANAAAAGAAVGERSPTRAGWMGSPWQSRSAGAAASKGKQRVSGLAASPRVAAASGSLAPAVATGGATDESFLKLREDLVKMRAGGDVHGGDGDGSGGGSSGMATAGAPSIEELFEQARQQLALRHGNIGGRMAQESLTELALKRAALARAQQPSGLRKTLDEGELRKSARAFQLTVLALLDPRWIESKVAAAAGSFVGRGGAAVAEAAAEAAAEAGPMPLVADERVKSILPRVPNRFQSIEHYEDTMRTLLMDETREGLISGLAASRAARHSIAARLERPAEPCEQLKALSYLNFTVQQVYSNNAQKARGNRGGGNSGYGGFGRPEDHGCTRDDVLLLRAPNGALCLGLVDIDQGTYRQNRGSLRVKIAFTLGDHDWDEENHVDIAGSGGDGGSDGGGGGGSSGGEEATRLLRDAILNPDEGVWRVEPAMSLVTATREFVAMRSLRKLTLVDNIVQASNKPCLIVLGGAHAGSGGGDGGGGSSGASGSGVNTAGSGSNNGDGSSNGRNSSSDNRAGNPSGGGSGDGNSDRFVMYAMHLSTVQELDLRLRHATERCKVDVDGGPLAEQEALGILATLSSCYVAAAQLKQVGTLGPRLKSLSRHSSPRIKAIASAIVAKWRRLLADKAAVAAAAAAAAATAADEAASGRRRHRDGATDGNDGEEIVTPQRPELVPPPLWEELAKQFNPSQLKAIWAAAASAAERESSSSSSIDINGVKSSKAGQLPPRCIAAPGGEVVLLQGPPGTGKTRTVLGVVSAILARRQEEAEVAAAAAASAAGRASPGTVRKRRSSLSQPPTRRARMVWGGSAIQSHQRVLVCAPSNGAVDELTQRLIVSGIWDARGRNTKPRIVRIGTAGDNTVEAVQTSCLRWLVDDRLKGHRVTLEHEDADARINAIHSELRNAAAAAAENSTSMQPPDGPPGWTNDGGGSSGASSFVAGFASGGSRGGSRGGSGAAARRNLQRELFEQHKRRRAARIALEAERRRVRIAIINDAQVVCATLSGSGSADLVETVSVTNKGFDTVIIDEACQAVETSTLIPLMLGCRRLILVGDPRQLPATVLSRAAASCGFEMSLFERFERAGHNVHMLLLQYRMLPAIRAFPSQQFYGGRLRDGAAHHPVAPFADDPAFAPLRFYDIRGTEGRVGRSVNNATEAAFAFDVVDALRRRHLLFARARAEAMAAGQNAEEMAARQVVGIITPYQGQVQRLRQEFARRWDRSELGDYATWVEISTVDGFQGRECDVVVFSCVRSGGGVGFLADARRMCVGITRAKRCLVVLGDARTLQRDKAWKAFVEHCRGERCLVPADHGFAAACVELNGGAAAAGGGAATAAAGVGSGYAALSAIPAGRRFIVEAAAAFGAAAGSGGAEEAAARHLKKRAHRQVLDKFGSSAPGGEDPADAAVGAAGLAAAAANLGSSTFGANRAKAAESEPAKKPAATTATGGGGKKKDDDKKGSKGGGRSGGGLLSSILSSVDELAAIRASGKDREKKKSLAPGVPVASDTRKQQDQHKRQGRKYEPRREQRNLGEQGRDRDRADANRGGEGKGSSEQGRGRERDRRTEDTDERTGTRGSSRESGYRDADRHAMGGTDRQCSGAANGRAAASRPRSGGVAHDSGGGSGVVGQPGLQPREAAAAPLERVGAHAYGAAAGSGGEESEVPIRSLKRKGGQQNGTGSTAGKWARVVSGDTTRAP